MAYVRNRVRGDSSPSNSRIIVAGLGRLLRWLAIPALGLALTGWCIATFASLYSATSLAPQESFVAQALSLPSKIGPGDPRDYAVRVASILSAAPAALAPKTERVALVAPARLAPAVEAVKPAPQDPFATIASTITRHQVLAAFAERGLPISEPAMESAAAEQIIVAYATGKPVDVIVKPMLPVSERFGPDSVAFGPKPGELEPSAPLAIALAGQMEATFAMASAPSAEAAWGSLARLLVDEPVAEKPVQVAVAKPALRPKPVEQETQVLAFAKPDKPVDSKPFNKLFKRQDKVAIYDISAGVVHMPDGSKLEAHSGIGKMADNPKYVHVKNSGPTPPNTYKLTMRESRFYGVEAIRMTPITSQPMHGRDGFLTHSYLLRSRRPESHGCVAFADYPRFLKAFKQGKVKHLVVVPSLKDYKAPKGRSERGA